MINNKTVGLIAAVDINGLLGINGTLPWKNSADLKRFKELTLNTTLVMGSNTFDSLPKKLPNRTVHVLSSKDRISTDSDVVYFKSIIEAIKSAPTSLVWIAGGAQVYQEALLLHIPDIIDISIINGIHINIDKKDKKVYMPNIDYMYQVVSEQINDLDDKLFHRRYEIRKPWGWNESL